MNNAVKIHSETSRYSDGSSSSIPVHLPAPLLGATVPTAGGSGDITSRDTGALTSAAAAVAAASAIVTPGIDWNPEKTERLINLFEAEVPLWNTKHPRHLDREERRVALLRISKDLKIAPAEIEKKLRGLRSYYSRELSKIQESVRNSSAPDEVYSSPWVFFTRLGFLNKFVHPRPPKRTPEAFYVDLGDYSKSTQEFDSEETDSGIHQQNTIIRDSTLEESIVSERACNAIKRDSQHHDEQEEMEMGSFGGNCLLPESNSTSPPPLKRKARYNDSISVASAMDENMLYPAIRMVQSDSEVDDEDLCFGRHVALSLKKMSHWTKELAKLQIQQQVLYKCYFSQSPDVAAALSQQQSQSLQLQQQSRTLSPSPSTSSDYSSF